MFNVQDMKAIVANTNNLNARQLPLQGIGSILLAILCIVSIPMFTIISILDAIEVFIK